MLESQRMVQILLASNSARRRELIQLTGWDVIMTAAEIDETRLANEPAKDHVLRLAREKARAVMNDALTDHILTADTIVVDRDIIIGKPANTEDAYRILQILRGHIHKVMTAITLYDRKTNSMLTDLCITQVPMRAYTDAEILTYVSSGDAMDKAGAYAIQNRDFHPVESFRGCFASVMGMPLCHLERTANKLGLIISGDLPERCQATLRYRCGIHEAVLRGDIIG
jgi:septum formation protein